MKRRMTALSIALLLVLSLAGCGSESSATIPETTVAVTETTVPETTETAIEPTETVIETTEPVIETTEAIIETTAVVAESTTQPTEPTEEMVWIPTHGGTKYHSRAGCSNMIDPAQVPISEAIARGFGPCGRCY